MTAEEMMLEFFRKMLQKALAEKSRSAIIKDAK